VHVAAPVGQVPGRDQFTSAIAARSGEHEHTPRSERVHGQLGHAATGVLHHLRQFDVEVFDHGPIPFAHLFRGDRRETTRGRFRQGLAGLVHCGLDGVDDDFRTEGAVHRALVSDLQEPPTLIVVEPAVEMDHAVDPVELPGSGFTIGAVLGMDA
jgi:hypothetical protein